MGRCAVVSLLSYFWAASAAAEGAPSPRILPEVTLPAAQGGSAPLVDRAAQLTAVVFLDAGQERSLEAVRVLAGCRARLSGEPVRLAVVARAGAADAVALAVRAAGLDAPVLVDEEDAVQVAAGVRSRPAVALADRSRRVVAFEPYHQVGWCDVIVARVQRALGRIGDADVDRVIAPAATALPGDAPGGTAHRHVALARRLLAARSFGPAHDSVRKAIALAPTAEAWALEGEVFAAEGRCAEALRAFDAALALAPGDRAAAAGRQACGGPGQGKPR